MTPSANTYPKEIVSLERATEDAAETPVVTVVSNEYEERGVLAAMAYMTAWNANDVKTLRTCLNYPHARVGAAGGLVVTEEADQMPDDFFERFRQRDGWNRSCWESREVIQSSESKVHLRIRFARYRADGSRIGTYPSIWIMTNQDGHWAIKMRSSFAG